MGCPPLRPLWRDTYRPPEHHPVPFAERSRRQMDLRCLQDLLPHLPVRRQELGDIVSHQRHARGRRVRVGCVQRPPCPPRRSPVRFLRRLVQIRAVQRWWRRRAQILAHRAIPGPCACEEVCAGCPVSEDGNAAGKGERPREEPRFEKDSVKVFYALGYAVRNREDRVGCELCLRSSVWMGRPAPWGVGVAWWLRRKGLEVRVVAVRQLAYPERRSWAAATIVKIYGSTLAATRRPCGESLGFIQGSSVHSFRGALAGLLGARSSCQCSSARRRSPVLVLGRDWWFTRGRRAELSDNRKARYHL